MRDIWCLATSNYCDRSCGPGDPCAISSQPPDHHPALYAYAELKPDIEAAQGLRKVVENPPLSQVIRELGAIPPEGLFMGMAHDELPMLLNLHDPVPGPILALGDEGAGKTDLLKIIAAAAGITHSPSTLKVGVLTSHPEEWEGFEHIPTTSGVFPLYSNSSQEFLLNLARWARGSKPNSECYLLLLDNLEAATDLDFEARQTLRWLFLRGPSRRVWPIVTLNANRSYNMRPWLEAFRTRIFGATRDDRTAKELGANGANLQTLNSNVQFTMRADGNWTRFWLPTLD